MDGIFLIDKPSGLTSHDVVYQIRRKFNIKKVGHTGTLDPFATGLMIILVGKATKLAFLFDVLDKGYQGKIVLGKSYDTDDTTGTVLKESKVDMNTDLITKAINELQPSYMQLPPSYSAIKVDGMKSYQAKVSNLNQDLYIFINLIMKSLIHPFYLILMFLKVRTYAV